MKKMCAYFDGSVLADQFLTSRRFRRHPYQYVRHLSSSYGPYTAPICLHLHISEISIFWNTLMCIQWNEPVQETLKDRIIVTLQSRAKIA